MPNTIPAYWEPINCNLAGDFIGFTFDNIHSSDFNLTRVSNGSRFESNLLPSFSDSTVQGDGKDGPFYFGSVFKERTIKVQTAFDNLTEKKYRKLRDTFSDKKLHMLWFDEIPFKVYYVKLKQVPTFKYLCFGEDGQRIYKGELDLEFVCYSSFARARASHLDQIIPPESYVITSSISGNSGIVHNHFLAKDVSNPLEPSFVVKQFYKYYGKDGATLADSYNFSEWRATAGIDYYYGEEGKETKKTFETIEIPEGTSLPVYNPGSKAADLKILYSPQGDEKNESMVFPGTRITLRSKDNKILGSIGIKSFSLKSKDSQIVIDSCTHLISGIDDKGQLTGNVYNKYHINGDFFSLPEAGYEDGMSLLITGEKSGKWQAEYVIYYI